MAKTLRMLVDPAICKCGTRAKKTPFSGKRRYPHKCPHGKWCAFGDRVLGHHANHNNLCRKCRAEETARRLAADEGYQRSIKERS